MVKDGLLRFSSLASRLVVVVVSEAVEISFRFNCIENCTVVKVVGERVKGCLQLAKFNVGGLRGYGRSCFWNSANCRVSRHREQNKTAESHDIVNKSHNQFLKKPCFQGNS